MATKVPPRLPPAPADPAAEAARQWNRDLRHAVTTAKVHAREIGESRRGQAADTPKQPCMIDAAVMTSQRWRDRSAEYQARAAQAQAPDARRAYEEVSRSCATIAARLEQVEAAALQKPARGRG